MKGRERGGVMRVRVNDEISINYELTGDPARQRVLVLTHGMGGTLHNWDDDIPELSKRYAVLRWDVRGHGESDKPDMPYTAEMHAHDLAGLLRALGLSRVFVGGVSMGGAITQRFLIDFPSLSHKTYFTLGMRDRGILWNRPTLPNLAHTEADVAKTLKAAAEIRDEMARVDVEGLMSDRLPMVLFEGR